MAYKVRETGDANVDLIEIDKYLTDFPKKASAFFASYNKQTEFISIMPYMHPFYEEAPPLRAMQVLEYIAFYTVNDATEELVIHRILPGKMDYYKQMKPNTTQI